MTSLLAVPLTSIWTSWSQSFAFLFWWLEIGFSYTSLAQVLFLLLWIVIFQGLMFISPPSPFPYCYPLLFLSPLFIIIFFFFLLAIFTFWSPSYFSSFSSCFTSTPLPYFYLTKANLWNLYKDYKIAILQGITQCNK